MYFIYEKLTIKYTIDYNLIGFEKNLLHNIINLLFTSKALVLYTVIII